MHLQTLLITVSECISEFTQSWYRIASTSSLDHSLKVHLQNCLINASKCISTLARSQPPSQSLSSLRFQLQLNLHTRPITAWVHSIVIFRPTWNCSHAPPAGRTDIPGVDGWLYRELYALMRIQTEWMSYKNRWTRSSGHDFQANRQWFQRRYCFSQAALLWVEVLPDMSPAFTSVSLAFPGSSRLVPGAPRLVTGAPCYSEGLQRFPAKVWYSPEIDGSKFTLCILSETPGRFQWPIFSLQM